MKELKLYNGGHPSSLNDLKLLQDAGLQIVENIIKGLVPAGTSRCILWGCAHTLISGSDYNLSEGAIYYEGKIYKVEAATFTGLTQFWVKETVDLEIPVTYQDTVEHVVHVEEKLKLQTGAGLFELTDIDRLEALVIERLGLYDIFATSAGVTAALAAFRNGYDPIIEVSSGGVIQWAYASPIHPDAPGSGTNPWRPLGATVVFYSIGTAGLFEARINTNKFTPVEYQVPEICLFDTEEADEGDNFSILRRYVAPVGGSYNFVLDNIELTSVSNTVPWTGATVAPNAEYRIGIYVNGVLASITGGFAESKKWLVTDGTPTIGTIHAMPIIDVTLTLVSGDEVTIRQDISENDGVATVGISHETFGERATDNVRASYRLSKMHFYTV